MQMQGFNNFYNTIITGGRIIPALKTMFEESGPLNSFYELFMLCVFFFSPSFIALFAKCKYKSLKFALFALNIVAAIVFIKVNTWLGTFLICALMVLSAKLDSIRGRDTYYYAKRLRKCQKLLAKPNGDKKLNKYLRRLKPDVLIELCCFSYAWGFPGSDAEYSTFMEMCGDISYERSKAAFPSIEVSLAKVWGTLYAEGRVDNPTPPPLPSLDEE